MPDLVVLLHDFAIVALAVLCADLLRRWKMRWRWPRRPGWARRWPKEGMRRE